MNHRYDNILQTIGNTQIVKLNKLAPEGVNVWVKVESFNPMGSVKDRLALGVIEAAERDGSLQPGQTIVPLGSMAQWLLPLALHRQRGRPSRQPPLYLPQ